MERNGKGRKRLLCDIWAKQTHLPPVNTPWWSDGLRAIILMLAVGIIRAANHIKTRRKTMRAQKQIGSGLLALAIGLALAVSGCTEGKKEVTLKFADCPAVVQKTILDHAGGVQFSEIDKETKKDGRVVYEAKGKRADGKKIEIKVAADGSLVGFANDDDD